MALRLSLTLLSAFALPSPAFAFASGALPAPRRGAPLRSAAFDLDMPDGVDGKVDGGDAAAVGHRLDPEDWDEYRAQMHALLDACVDRMESYRDKPWVPPAADLAAKVALDAGGDGETAGAGRPLPDVLDSLVEDIMPHATGNTNPRFFGWVHGAGLPSSIAADLVAATMNSNCGGRNHAAADVEVACVDFLTRATGFPAAEEAGATATTTPFGVLTTGTSQATIYALMAARTRKFGLGVRRQGVGDLGPVRVYIGGDGHSCVSRAMECVGHGVDSVTKIPLVADGSMDLAALRRQLEEDRERGIAPLAIVGTAGSVSIGAYDDFTALAELAREYNTWLHVDAAFGFWTRLSNDPRIQGLTSGLNRADSIALDAHKWPGVNYSVGALLVKDKEHLRATMMTRPKYLKSATEGLAAGDTWFTDYSLDLSRGFSALKLWAALRTAGRDAIGQVITDHCHLAAHLARLVDASPVLSMAHRPCSNVACFSIDAPGVTAAEVATDLQLGGNGVFSTINLGGVDCLRAAIVNHRCTEADIARCIASVEEAVARKTLEKTIVK